MARTALATLGLFAVAGFGPTRLALPAEWRPYEAVFVLPVGAACSTLALTVLGIVHVPLVASLAVVLAGGAVLGVVALRRVPGGLRVAPAVVPLGLAALIAAIVLLPSFRAGFAAPSGQNGDAVLAVGTAELLRHAPPDAVRPELPLDRVPVVWRSKLPIYYGLAGGAELAGQDTLAAFPTVGAIVLALGMAGFFLFALLGLGAPIMAALAVPFVLALDRMTVYVTIHPYFNQTWALFALPFVLLLGWRALERPARGTLVLAGLFTALALFTYPLLLPFPAVFLGLLAWGRRRELDWRSLVGVRVRRRWPWAVAAVVAVPVAAVLVRGVVEKVVPALDALRPGGDLSGWSGSALPYLPFARFFGLEDHPLALVGVLVAAVAGLWALRPDVRRALGVLLAGALLAALYLRARGQGELFYFKDLSFAAPLILMLAVVGGARRLPGWAAVLALVLLVAALAGGARQEIALTYEQTPRGLLALRDWDRELPAGQTIRIDVEPSGIQMWTWYLMPRHRVSARDPLAAFFPHPPRGLNADLVIARRAQGRPRDAVGAPIRSSDQMALYRLRRGLPGPDVSSRALIFEITSVSLG